MADILINNIELPKEGTMWLILYPNGMVTYTHPYNEDVVVTDSKAIEVPTHGRLIDADEFITELRATINKVLLGSLLHNIFVNDESVKQDTLDGINFVLDRLENAPTVLEASNG